jgi:hypothetical protein
MPSSIPVPIGLAGERSAAARVDPERREQRDLRQHPEDGEEALEPFCPLDELGREDLPRIGEREVVGHLGGPE